MSNEVSVTVDITEGELALQQLQQHSDMTLQHVMNIARRGYGILHGVLGMFDKTMPLAFQMVAQGIFRVGEAFMTMRAAQAAMALSPGIGQVMAISSIISYASAVSLFFRAVAIQNQAKEIDETLSRFMGLMSSVA